MMEEQEPSLPGQQRPRETLHDTQTPFQPFFKPTAQGAKDDGAGGGEPQLPGLKMNVCPYSGTLVQTGTGASLPPREQSHPWESKGAAREGLTLWEGGADCNGGNTMFWPPLPLSMQRVVSNIQRVCPSLHPKG